MLAKTNYKIHTDSIKQNIVLKITENQKKYFYAELINDNISQKERLIKLNNSAIRQMKVLENDKTIKELEALNKNLIEIK